MSDVDRDQLREPVLPGPGASDYERYLRTDELLSLQKSAPERNHHDELLFTVVHQSSELWLKLAGTEIRRRPTLWQRDEVPRRTGCCAARSCAWATSPTRSTCSGRCPPGTITPCVSGSATAVALTRPAFATSGA